MIFGDVNVYNIDEVTKYFQLNYPNVVARLVRFNLIKASKMKDILKGMSIGEQITFHAFPGLNLEGNSYIHPRFLRIDSKGTGEFSVTREKSIRERSPSVMTVEDIILYYFDLADLTYMNAQTELSWNNRWPPRSRIYK